VDLRVMAASNRDLAEEVQAGRFRRDLYYRLGVVSLTVPALRDRREDVAALAESYIEYLRPRIGSDVDSISPAALTAMEDYSWPGNVRELINVIERAMLLCEGREITPADLPEAVAGAASARPGAVSPAHVLAAEDLPAEVLQRPLQEVRQEILENVERAYLTALLRETGGRVGETARRAGIEPRSLYDKMKRHGLTKERFRPRRGRSR